MASQDIRSMRREQVERCLSTTGMTVKEWCGLIGVAPSTMVNALHSRLKEFLEPFHGVATRRLQHYLDWFCYREQFRKSDADKREVTFADAAAGEYQTSRREYALTPHPFMGYWGMGAMSTVV